MAGRRRKNTDNPSATGPGALPAESLLPADFDLADLYGAHGSDEGELDLDDAAVLVPRSGCCRRRSWPPPRSRSR